MGKLIKDIYNESDDFPILDLKYDVWIKKLLNKTEDEVTENDVYTMFMQHELEDLAIKKSIEFIFANPLAGEMWNGQFLEQLSAMALDNLAPYKDELKSIPEYVLNNINDSMWDFDEEKEEFIGRLKALTETIENL